ncbi:hypothetical protein GOBAR_AA11804 [Gossypium barbadense]|uniref:TF-B3 domain-containing protein n=1 Tax=Gossypium barbadense TaxID=3634 RepID=A0A2P5XZR7_GOSBA|nr:hypothetical protein GOBAR_AA11804 [Gossypium barbadense]
MDFPVRVKRETMEESVLLNSLPPFVSFHHSSFHVYFQNSPFFQSHSSGNSADNSIASQLRTGSLVSVTEPDCQQTRCPYSSSELKDSKLKTQKNIDFQNSTKELKGDWGCLKPDLVSKMQPLTPTEKQRATDIASWSSLRLVSGKSKEKSHLPCSLPQKKMRINSPNQHGQNSKLEVLSSGISSDAQRSVTTEALSCVQRLTAIEKAHAVQIASAFKSTENPVFMIVMRPSYVLGKCRMFIPSNFTRKFLTMYKCNLTLCNSTGKTWHAKFFRYPENKKPNAHLYGGWCEFVEDNHLNVGDICVFELIKHPEILMKVLIYPVVKNASKACGPQALGSIVSRVKTRSLVSDAKRSCQQSARPPSSREFIDLTDSYIESLDDSPLDQKTKKKMTSPSFQPCKLMRTNPSESNQAKGIKLEKEKKSLNFQYLTKEVGGELKYSVRNDRERRSSARRCPKPDPVYGKQRACVGASAFRTSNPSFSVVIHPSYIGSSSSLHIPVEFVKRYLKKSGEMVLRVVDGRIWIVEYRRKASNKGGKAKFGSRSWGQFAKDNQLEVGDVCVFELMNENGNLLEVAIHRKHLLIEIA